MWTLHVTLQWPLRRCTRARRASLQIITIIWREEPSDATAAPLWAARRAVVHVLVEFVALEFNMRRDKFISINYNVIQLYTLVTTQVPLRYAPH